MIHIEHPDIAKIERTGYIDDYFDNPDNYEDRYLCSNCGAPVYEDKPQFIHDGELICEDCEKNLHCE